MNSKIILGGVAVILILASLRSTPTDAQAKPPYITEYVVPTSWAGPLAVAVDRNDNIWFTESSASKLAVFFPSNESFREIPVGKSDLEMWGLTIAPDGRVWFTGHGRVNGLAYVACFDTGLERFTWFQLEDNTFPMRILSGNDGNLWVTLFSGNSLVQLNPRTAQIQYYDTPGDITGPAGLTWDRNGKLWVSFALSNQIASFDTNSGRFAVYSPPTIGSPVGIATDARGDVWFADHGANWIVRYNPSGDTFERFPTSTPPAEAYPISIPNELKIDTRGLVWFAEHGGNKIGYVDPYSQMLVEYHIPTGPISTVLWFDFDSAGNVWFAEFDGNKLGKLTPAPEPPFDLTLEPQRLSMLAGGSVTTNIKIILNERQASPEALSLHTSDAGIDLHSEFTSQTWQQNTFMAQLRLSLDDDAKPGTRRLAITVSDGLISVGRYLDVSMDLPTGLRLPLTLPVLVASLALALAIGFFAFTLRGKSRFQAQSLP